MKSFNLNFQCTGEEQSAFDLAQKFVRVMTVAGHRVHVAALTHGSAENILASVPVAEEKNDPENPPPAPPKMEDFIKVGATAIGAAMILNAMKKEKCPACAGSGSLLPGTGVPCEKCGGTGNA